ncbi:hypothetical protein ACFSLT_21525 [Novosphingobium resinovorum]
MIGVKLAPGVAGAKAISMPRLVRPGRVGVEKVTLTITSCALWNGARIGSLITVPPLGSATACNPEKRIGWTGFAPVSVPTGPDGLAIVTAPIAIALSPSALLKVSCIASPACVSRTR